MITVGYKKYHQILLSLSKKKNNNSDIYQEYFLDKAINFANESVVKCDVPVVKNTFVDDGNIQIVTKKI